METLGALFPFVLILGAFYLLIIRPSRNRQRAALQMQQELTVGSEVMTTSGMYGRVTSVEDDTFGLEVSPGVTVRVAKAALGRIVPADDAAVEVAGDEQASGADTVARDDVSGDDRPSR